jgi:dUTP pyrophosphatase
MESTVAVKTVVTSEEFLPVYASELAAGADLRACIDQSILLPPSESVLIPTGLKMEIPAGYEIQIRPRSGLALKHKITVLNTPGTIDADYRGEIGVILINHGKEPFEITRGFRIAQAVLAKVEKAEFVKENILEATLRGSGGFGHSGTH